ncbi:hypothetical protein M409DRAFT_25569 [Zasmidium cellare ATCC 36951]|uniref:Zn(2)-C6 fungal-type domain-containing protein n=1 Tax=Zasmidium cellare ATCC 36951 TaxID=1080233 RepID=A0A6A6CAK9_ZASCE|nr:uncharacterized protein M409DRAFT_25569 [Zasmidium cellare ATCC 36951]KAF2164227.1 hypothetical protein M409DRAFT_25569 [Zasmidium cellare ATCC 36951]
MDPPRRPKQRNKPTLNCLACVERKSRCDRGRPACFTCVKRQVECQYTPVANFLAASQAPMPRPRKERRPPATPPSTVTPSGCPQDALTVEGLASEIVLASASALPETGDEGVQFGQVTAHTGSDERDDLLATDMYIFRLLDLLFPDQTLHWKIAARFSTYLGQAFPIHFNYWTDAGGLVEVIAALPAKDEADILLERFFQAIHPLYPIVPRESFMADYDRFWLLLDEEKHASNAAHVALQFAIFAVAAQDMHTQATQSTRADFSEFYLSCCHQGLCLSSYLNHHSVATVQTMVLICHFLIATDRISDAWTISGITQRLAYHLKLNCHPNRIGLASNYSEAQLRCRLWQATMMQDTQLSLWLGLPATTMYYDVEPDHFCSTSLSSIEDEGADLSDPTLLTDNAYIRTMWRYSSFVQTNVCVLRSRKQPLPNGTEQTITSFRDLYHHFDPPFNSLSPSRFENQPPRLLYQHVAVSSSYFSALMLLQMEQATDTFEDQCSAAQSAHEGMSAFFALARLSPNQVERWGEVHNRTFTMAVIIGTLLATKRSHPSGDINDPRLTLAKSDFERYVRLLERAQGTAGFRKVQQERLANLKELRAAF